MQHFSHTLSVSILEHGERADNIQRIQRGVQALHTISPQGSEHVHESKYIRDTQARGVHRRRLRNPFDNAA